jgi:hypothetical protein
VKTPGTNKRVRRARPESEWRVVPHPELQIVSSEVWQRVQDRQKRLMAMYSGAKKGLLPRSITSPYLLSGILKCGLCGGNLIIVTGFTSYGHYPRYGCSQHFNRGACSNSVTIRRDWLERRLLEELQNEVLKRDAVEYALDEFDRHLKSAFSKLTNQMAHMRERKQKLEGELRRLTETAAETGPSSFLVAAIHEREQQLREITDQLLAGGADSVDAHLTEIRGFITKRLADLQRLISGEPAEARKELMKHVSEIRMFPQDNGEDGNGKPHYVAEGTWRLVGSEEETGSVMSPQIRSVADPRNQLRANQPISNPSTGRTCARLSSFWAPIRTSVASRSYELRRYWPGTVLHGRTAVIVRRRQVGMTHQRLLDIERSLFSAEKGAVGVPVGMPANAAKSLFCSDPTTSIVDESLGLFSASRLCHGADLAGRRPAFRT